MTICLRLLATTVPTTELRVDPLVIGPFVILLLAIPVLLMGEWLVHRLTWLKRLSIPAAVIGGLIVATGVLGYRIATNDAIRLNNSTTSGVWHWFNTTELGLGAVSPQAVHTPLLAMFFTCVGLNASWAIAGKNSRKLVLFLLLAAVLAVVQYVVGAGTAIVMGESALLGMICSGVALMGGFGTAAGFAQEFNKAGLAEASSIGVAAAAMGVVVGGLIAGPMGTWLVRANHLVVPAGSRSAGDSTTRSVDEGKTVEEGGFLAEVSHVVVHIKQTLMILAIALVCMKAGAFLSQWIIDNGSPVIRKIPGVDPTYTIAFPIYLGSMLLAVLVRNVHDLLGLKWIQSKHVDVIGSVVLAWLLTAVMIALRLRELIDTATAMVVIVVVQVVVIVLFCRWVVFTVMGRDYEAAAMSSGMIGFGLGATSNALASIRALALRFGPAPQAVIIVSVVGAFLIDFINVILLTIGLNLHAGMR